MDEELDDWLEETGGIARRKGQPTLGPPSGAEWIAYSSNLDIVSVSNDGSK